MAMDVRRRLRGWRGAGAVAALLTLVAFAPEPAMALAPPDWFPTASLAVARDSPSATLLADGKALVTGGVNDSGPIASAELYDPVTRTWSSAGTLAVGRDGASATRLLDGRVLVAGGLSGVFEDSYRAELYDPATNTWSATGSMSLGRTHHTATLLPGGNVLVAGGSSAFASATAELYDPETQTWSRTANPRGRHHQGHTATLLPDGDVLVAGGDVGGLISGGAERYDVASGTWSAAASMTFARTRHTATLLPDGRTLVTGGAFADGVRATAELYDATNDRWSVAGTMGSARESHTATLLPSGEVLVTGGASANPGEASELYDVPSDSWRATATMATSRGSHAATLLNTGFVLVAGGRSAAGGALASAEEFGIDSTAPAAPVLAGTSPASPANDDAPLVRGTAEAGSTIRFFVTEDCSGEPAAAGPAASFAAAGIAVPVARDASSALRATATDKDSNTSLCSQPLAYVEDSTAPRTTIVSGPPAIAGSAATLAFVTSEPGAGARLECRLDGAAFAACASPVSYAALPDGPHTFEARAIDAAGNVDPEPAMRAWVVDTGAPVARFTAAPNPVLTGRSVTFDASGSSDAGSGIVRYEWDLDGDGTFEQDTGPTSSTTRAYAEPGTYGVLLRVTDGAGRSATARSDQRVVADNRGGPLLGVSIDAGARFTNDPHVTIKASWPTFASLMLISNDGGFEHAQSFPLQAVTPWTLDSTGAERQPRLVYVRFTRGNTVSETYIDDIILDERAPLVTSARVVARKGGQAPLLRLRARDRGLAGVARVQVTNDRRAPSARYRASRATIALTHRRGERKLSVRKRIYVRVRDRAGNVSAWRLAQVRGAA